MKKTKVKLTNKEKRKSPVPNAKYRNKKAENKKAENKKYINRKNINKKVVNKKLANKKVVKRKVAKEKGTSKWIMLLGSSKGFGLLLFTFFLLVIMLSVLYVSQKFKVRTVYVQGNKHYTNEEIQDMVMAGKLGDNSLYLSLKYRNKGVENVPFVEKMDVEILSPDTIKIYVYEKALAGYVEYLGRNMYFDKDGIIVESSGEKTLGIPQVTGLDFGYVVLYEKLPVENDTVFRLVLNITQVLNKYELATDRIYFDSKYQITLYFGDAKAKIGGDDYLDEKVMKLKTILPELKGKKGTLRMENYSEDMQNITFELE